jgi:CRP/FNR family cyclic AMP-dependent transcriptional regulator
MNNERPTAAVLSALQLGRKIMRYQNNDIIYRQGEPSDALYYLVDGEVRFRVLSPNGKAAVVSLMGAGSFFGDDCLAGESVHFTTACSFGEAYVLRLESDAMWDLLHDNPELRETFITFLVSRKNQILKHLVDHIIYPAEKRLAKQLMLRARRTENGHSNQPLPKITQEVLAEMVGTTRPRISFYMKKFRDLGLINYQNGVLVDKSLADLVEVDAIE